MMKTKKISFFIDSLGGGGAERVISVLCRELTARNYDVDILMLNKRPIAYLLPEKVNLFYAEDMPVTTAWGKIVRKTLGWCMNLQVRFWNPQIGRAHV